MESTEGLPLVGQLVVTLYEFHCESIERLFDKIIILVALLTCDIYSHIKKNRIILNYKGKTRVQKLSFNY